MAAIVDIANLALSHLGVGKTIGSLTEMSEEARALSAFMDLANTQAQREFAWSFNTSFVTLQLVQERPTPEWLYAYQVPNKCLKLRRLLSGVRQDTRDTQVPYRLSSLGPHSVILTDHRNAQAEISTFVSDPNAYPPDYVSALSFLLAFYVAPRVTAGDPFKLGDRAFRAYQLMGGRAMAASANEEVMGEAPESELIRVRG